ncbi:hypothetical protein ACIBK9_17620 [Nonomuraea sp. NPDC050227]|uniref:hypothetical protein n=1 Tax=Nonomuraea sp. NPDC050227 TaxID=3364360 RepID=UPI00378B056C
MRAEMLANLSAADPGTRAEALRWFAAHGDFGDAAVVAPLVRDPGEFDDRDHDDPPESARTPVRMVALEVLARLRGPGMFTGVFDDALQDGDLRVRVRAALGASAGALLARLAVEGDRGVRYRIAVGLLTGDVGRDQAVAALERLRGGDDPAAVAAASVLGAVARLSHRRRDDG